MMSEIKRVLKSNGVLIISSPDKYYYSDVNQSSNKFHIKELYYDEFRKLISIHFNKTFFFSQRTITGSIIALDQGYNSYNKPLVVNQFGEEHSLYPLYNIAIATNNIHFELQEQIIFYSETDNAITDIEEARYLKEIEIKKTITWRVGKFILWPAKFLKKQTRSLV